MNACRQAELTEVEVPRRFTTGVDNCQVGQSHLVVVVTVSSLVTGVPPVPRLPRFVPELSHGRQDDESPLSENDAPNPQMSVEQTKVDLELWCYATVSSVLR